MREPLGRGIHRGGQPGRARPDHGDVDSRAWMELGRTFRYRPRAMSPGFLRIEPPGQTTSGRSAGLASVPGDHFRCIRVGLRIEDRVRMPRAEEELLEGAHPGIGGRADQNRSAEAERQQARVAGG